MKPGFEDQVPRTPDEFAARWKNSPERKALMNAIEDYDKKYPYEGEQYQKFVDSRKAQQAKRQRIKSPYTLSYGQQVRLCLWRGFCMHVQKALLEKQRITHNVGKQS